MDRRYLINFYKRAFAVFFALLPILFILETLVLVDLENVFRIIIHISIITAVIILVELIRSKILLKRELKKNAKKHKQD